MTKRARDRALGRRASTPGFAARLLVAQALVLVAGAVTSWLVASAVGPRVFRGHLRMAGVAHTAAEAEHVNEAFDTALLIALGVALLASVVLALAVTSYFTARLRRSIEAVTDSAAEIARGDYGLRVRAPELGSEFDKLADTFNELAQRLESVETMRQRMLADLAHEMRTPLATLDAHLEALEDGVRDLDDETLTVLRSNTRRLGRLAQDINAVSRAQEGVVDVRPVAVTPLRLVTDAIRAAQDRFEAKGVSLTNQVATDVVVNVDPERMAQVLGNLLDNALRHTPPGGTVTVSGRAVDRWVELVVADSGEGITPEHLPYLFDRFYRVDSARGRAQGGNGIGLTVTKALVQAHGGHVSAASAGPGRGATFTVALPAGG